jgi:hypothetical protein
MAARHPESPGGAWCSHSQFSGVATLVGIFRFLNEERERVWERGKRDFESHAGGHFPCLSSGCLK